jgi:hypothetical protein
MPARFASKNSTKGTVCVDFDGVLHSYTSPWPGSVSIIPDPPVDGALDFLRSLCQANYRVVIFSTRCREYPGHEGGAAAIRTWLQAHGLEDQYLDVLVLSSEKEAAIIYLDDHGWQFRGKFPTLHEIANFTTWLGKKSSTLPGGHNA